MASKNLFPGTGAGRGGVVVPPANTINEAGGTAYSFTAEHELAQLAATGMLGDTYYVSAEDQLERVLTLAKQVSPMFLAQLAIYSREQGKMKDMPALVAAVLFSGYAHGATALLKQIFLRIIDNGRMLRNFVQMVRSGRVGRKSLGTFGKKLVQSYFDSKSPAALFRDSVGNDPSLADVIKLAHPRPTNPERQALYRYIIGKELNAEQYMALPIIVKEFEAFKKGKAGERVVPNVPFQMLTAMDLTPAEWTKIALNGNWHFVRMNLNTFARHDVFNDKAAVKAIAEKLRDPVSIEKAKVFPYQLLVAYLNTTDIPTPVRDALQDAMEVATKNVPAFDAPNGVIVGVDVSGSMSSPVSGHRGSATTKVSCLDAASLIGACVLRRNPNSVIMPFDYGVHKTNLNGRDSVMTNAAILKGFGGGGTNCSSVLAEANARNLKADLVIYVSDNMSWVDSRSTSSVWGGGGTETMNQWRVFKKRNPSAKMVNINLTPAASTQASNDKDIINIGGFSDSIWEVISAFVSTGSTTTGKQWVDVIKQINLEAPTQAAKVAVQDDE